MQMKRLLQGASVLLTVASVGTAVAGFHFYNVAVKRSTKQFLTNNPDLAGVGAATTSEQENWLDAHGYADVFITSRDGLRLHGCYLPAAEPTSKTVILAHGYASCGKDMAGFAKFYYEQLGFNVLMPDARGHGESEGDYIGFGWHDRLDYLRWISLVSKQLGEQAEIVLHGISMGGATVLMAAGEHLPSQVKAVVSDCAYSSVRDQLAYQMKRMYKLPAFPVLNVTSLVTRCKSGYSLDEASAVRQMRKAKVPTLFIHGEDDTFVPYQMVHQLYAACAAPKQLLVVPGAGHGLAYSTDRQGYRGALRQFIGSVIDLR
jgi:hypothetical protein